MINEKNDLEMKELSDDELDSVSGGVGVNRLSNGKIDNMSGKNNTSKPQNGSVDVGRLNLNQEVLV